jgi:hypothetical protein
LQLQAGFNYDFVSQLPINSSIPIELPAKAEAIKTALGSELYCDDCFAYYYIGVHFDVSAAPSPDLYATDAGVI